MVISYIEALVPRRRIVQRFHADVRHIGAADALHREFKANAVSIYRNNGNCLTNLADIAVY